MQTGIAEGFQRTVSLAHDKDRLTDIAINNDVPRIGDIKRPACILPDLVPHFRHFKVVEFLAHIALYGDRLDLGNIARWLKQRLGGLDCIRLQYLIYADRRAVEVMRRRFRLVNADGLNEAISHAIVPIPVSF